MCGAPQTYGYARAEVSQDDHPSETKIMESIRTGTCVCQDIALEIA